MLNAESAEWEDADWDRRVLLSLLWHPSWKAAPNITILAPWAGGLSLVLLKPQKLGEPVLLDRIICLVDHRISLADMHGFLQVLGVICLA